MSILHHGIGLLGCLLLLVAAPQIYIRRPRFRRKAVTVYIFAMMGFSVLPVYGLPIIAYVRGITADLSITSLFLLSISIAEAYTGNRYFPLPEKRRLHGILILAGVILYPMALGLTPWDSYSAGYGGAGFVLALPVLFIGLILSRSWLILSALSCAILAYLIGLLESTNLWDYLIDVWLFLFVFLSMMWRLLINLCRSRSGAALKPKPPL